VNVIITLWVIPIMGQKGLFKAIGKRFISRLKANNGREEEGKLKRGRKACMALCHSDLKNNCLALFSIAATGM
jgi:hypothetical protein